MARRKPVGWRGESERHRKAALKGRRRMNREAMRWAIDPYQPKVVPSKLRELAIAAGWISPMQDMVDELRKGRKRKTVYGDYLTLAENEDDDQGEDLQTLVSDGQEVPLGTSETVLAVIAGLLIALGLTLVLFFLFSLAAYLYYRRKQ